MFKHRTTYYLLFLVGVVFCIRIVGFLDLRGYLSLCVSVSVALSLSLTEQSLRMQVNGRRPFGVDFLSNKKCSSICLSVSWPQKKSKITHAYDKNYHHLHIWVTSTEAFKVCWPVAIIFSVYCVEFLNSFQITQNRLKKMLIRY